MVPLRLWALARGVNGRGGEIFPKRAKVRLSAWEGYWAQTQQRKTSSRVILAEMSVSEDIMVPDA